MFRRSTRPSLQLLILHTDVNTDVEFGLYVYMHHFMNSHEVAPLLQIYNMQLQTFVDENSTKFVD